VSSVSSQQLATPNAFTPWLDELGPVSRLQRNLADGMPIAKAWPQLHFSHLGECVEVYGSHAAWYGELKVLFKRKSWHPDKLRIICTDPKTAAREATWIRKSQQPGRSDQWRAGEYVRSIDPIGPHPAGTEFRVGANRPITFGDTAGHVHWISAAGDQRTLEVAVLQVDVQAVKLTPITGGEAISWLVELPSHDFWHQRIQLIRNRLPDARRYPEALQQARELLTVLKGRVARLRPCTAITPELIQGRRFEHVGLHGDIGENPEAAVLAAAAAIKRLTVLADRPLYA